MIPVITEVIKSRADLLETVEERIRRLEYSHQELQRKLVRLEGCYSESSFPAQVIAHQEQLRSRDISIQSQLARLQGKTSSQFTRTESLVNRQRELEMIWKALLDLPNLKVLYFYGPGGVGKTRLLEETGHLVDTLHGRRDGIGRHRFSSLVKRLTPWRRQVASAFGWCNIVDLYHTDLHDGLSVQQAIVTAVDPAGTHFQNYRRLAADLQRARQESIDSRQLEEMQRGLTEAFVQDYNALAATQRIVLAFDTLEVIQHESPVVQKVCQIGPDSVAVEAWLLKRACQLENSVVLLAGRPRTDLFDTFQQAYSAPGQFQLKELTGFTWSETQEYVELLARQRPELEVISKGMLWRIHRATEGLPVRLALALELVLERGWEEMPTSSAEVDAVLGRNLFTELEQDEPLMFYLALARKGLEAELLHYLKPEWPLNECRQRLSALQNLTYVKTRRGASTLFLHDELYALFDLFGPERNKITAGYAKISEYYKIRQAKLEEVRGQRAWQQATAHWLFYRLRAAPREGYQSYVRLAEEAVKGHDFGFDMQLRDEVLQFFEDPTNREMASQYGVTPQVLDRDATLRWVRRYIEKGSYTAAYQVVVDVRQTNDPLFTDAGPLFHGTLDTYYGEATQYLGRLPEALKTLNEAKVHLSVFLPADEFEVWWCARILGRALNNIGYIHWQCQCYSPAAESFQAASLHYRRVDVKDELADTLNNLAFVFGTLGKFDEAESIVHEALSLRRELSLRYPLALGLNTLGLIQLGAGRLEQAQKHCTDALQICEELNAARGQGLAHIALGQVHRQMARRCTEATEAVTLLRQAEACLKQAVGIFEGQIREPLRLVEAANELGCTYRDLAGWMEKNGQTDTAQGFYRDAQDWLERSAAEAKEKWPVMMVDSYEDVARLFFARRMYQNARQWLERAAEAVPEAYHIQEQQGFPDLAEPVEGFWLMLGKIHLLYGHLNAEIGSLEPSLRQYVLALSYLDKYSPTVPASQRARSEIRQRLSGFPSHQQNQVQPLVNDLARVYCVSADSLLALLT